MSLNFGMVVGSLIKLWITWLGFIEKFFGWKNLGDVRKTGISKCIENLGGWYKSRKIKNWSKIFWLGLRNEQNEEIELGEVGLLWVWHVNCIYSLAMWSCYDWVTACKLLWRTHTESFGNAEFSHAGMLVTLQTLQTCQFKNVKLSFGL